MDLFEPFLRRVVHAGHLTIIDANGKRHSVEGAPIADLNPVTIRLSDPSLHWRIPFNPSVTVGEAYMDGTLTIEEGTLYDFLALASDNLSRGPNCALMGERWTAFMKRLQQFNLLAASRRNVAHHYNLSEDFYSLFLDADRQYSCAYFPESGMTLEEAQLAKKRLIMRKLLLEPGLSVLDIGCGWGGLALSMARDYDVEVTGITLSVEQLKVATRRAEEEGLSRRVKFLLTDYRELPGRFDRIVSVGMFEHVGVGHFGTFFRRLRALLKENGVALLHSMGRSEGPGVTNRWIRKYIFPGGYIPALSEVLPSIERSGLLVTDIEILRRHYARTLRLWAERFAQRRAEAAAIYDERFCRMWEFYLAGSEAAFRHDGLMNFHLQLAYPDAPLPRSRDYMLGSARR